MEQPTTTAKIIATVEESLDNKSASLLKYLEKGDLYSFEDTLTAMFQDIYNQTSELFIREAAQKVEPVLRAKAVRLKLGKLVKRPLRIQIRTGHYVEVEGLYARKVPHWHVGTRHLLHLHWKVLKGASPGYYSMVCLFCVLCPSFEVAGQVLGIQGIAHNVDRVMELTRHMARHCADKQAELSRAACESLEGKLVVIGIDGGNPDSYRDAPVNMMANVTPRVTPRSTPLGWSQKCSSSMSWTTRGTSRGNTCPFTGVSLVTTRWWHCLPPI